MEIKEVADVVRALQRAGSDEAHPCGKAVFLIGAGCSRSAGIPVGAEIVDLCAIKLAKAYHGADFGEDEADAAIALLIHKGDLPKESRRESLYGYLFEHHFPDAAEQHEIVQEAIGRCTGINWAHLCLGELVARKYVHTVLTTNFDQLALEGVIRTGQIPVIADGVESLNRLSGNPATPQVVHLHGSMHTYSPRNSAKAVSETGASPAMQAALYSLFRESVPLVVVGYGGGEEGVMRLLVSAANTYPNKLIYWVMNEQDPERLSDQAKELLDTGRNKFVVPGQDADAFFAQLMSGLGIGTPTWMHDPTGFLQHRAGTIVLAGHDDIDGEIKRYRRRLGAFAELQEREDAHEKFLGEVRELRLAGRHEEALERLWTVKSKDAEILWMHAHSAYVAGRASLEPDLLEESVEVWKKLLETTPREKDPERWARAQNDLGTVLQALGERSSNTNDLEDAIVAYRSALEVFTRERAPLDWAMTQNNLGNALATLGERSSDPSRLEEAVDAYRAALEVYTLRRVPLAWAATQNNLGNALSRLGERSSDTSRLEEAVDAYRAALEVRTRERVPLDWAMTQDNLATALTTIGERSSDPSRLEKAVDAYRATLEVRIREHVPLDWAATQNNLGNALSRLGERSSDTSRLEEAVDAYRAALEVRTRERVPLDWAMTQDNLGTALATIGKRASDTSRLEEAIDAYRAALEVRTRELVPLAWALTQNNLGTALARLGECAYNTSRLEEAVKAYRAALEVFREARPRYLELTERNLLKTREVLERLQRQDGEARD
jgi:tetratricopeptide (TPR) repeat protein